MRHNGGIGWGCLVLLTHFACSSPVPPPPEGSARLVVSYAGTHVANINGGTPPNLLNHVLGKTVLDGRDGYKVSCEVKGGGQFSVSGLIESADGTSASVDGHGISAQGGTVSMSFNVNGVVNVVSDSACTVSTTSAPVVEAGSIWAAFNCSKVMNVAADPTLTGSATGEFVFTGCSR